MIKTLELPGDFAPWPPYQGLALDPMGALSGPQTPRPIILHPPPFLIPGYGPDLFKKIKITPSSKANSNEPRPFNPNGDVCI